jgi:hypothetical protein
VACTRGKRTQHGKPHCVIRDDQPDARERQAGRFGVTERFAVSRVMPVEGRSLSSRQTQDVVRDLEIGQPINSEKCSETADGVTRKSEGGSRLSLLRPVRQDQPRRHPGACLCPVPVKQELVPAKALGSVQISMPSEAKSWDSKGLGSGATGRQSSLNLLKYKGFPSFVHSLVRRQGAHRAWTARISRTSKRIGSSGGGPDGCPG